MHAVSHCGEENGSKMVGPPLSGLIQVLQAFGHGPASGFRAPVEGSTIEMAELAPGLVPA